MASVTPPAGTATMSLTVRLGKVWAMAGPPTLVNSPSAAASNAILVRNPGIDAPRCY
jgi:hypothetical protein